MANVGKVWNGTAWVDLGSTATFQSAGTATVGVVQLTDSTSSTSTTTAATPNSVKSAYDLAGTAIPKNTVTAAGDILYASGSATVTRLGIGTAGQVLGIAAGVPAWTTPASGGGYTLLATATPSAATSLSFGSISGSYKHLFVVWRNVRQSAQDVGWAVRLNNDSGTNYRFHLICFDEGSMSPVYNLKDREEFGVLINDAGVIPSTGSADDQNVSTGYLWVYRYTESESKILISRASGEGSSSSTMRVDIEGTYTGTSTITSIDFIRQSTQTITGTFFLYGVS